LNETTGKLASGTAWTTAGEVVASLAALAGTVVAARLVPPTEFGRMGIVLLLLATIEAFTQSGFEQALVQREREVNDLLDVAWTWTLVRGLGIGVVMCAAAPLLAALYDDPVLVPVICASALVPAVRGVANVGVVLYRRELDFRAVFGVGIGAPLVRLAVVIAAALAWRNVWALVVAAIAEAVAFVVASYAGHPYRARLSWSWPRLKTLVRFGRWVTAVSILAFLVLRGDHLFVSKVLGYEALAFYQLAFQIANLPATNITHVVGRVSFPTYAKLQGDAQQLRRAFLTVVRGTMLAALPIGVALVACADLVPLLLGERWAPVVPLVRLLALGGILRAFLALGGALFMGTGRPDLDVRMNLPRLIVLALAIWPLAVVWGLSGVCVATLCALCACLPAWFWGVRSQASLAASAALRPLAPAVVGSLALGVVLFGLRALALAR
jgi:O-antigen/teichoic acid export membrane protein